MRILFILIAFFYLTNCCLAQDNRIPVQIKNSKKFKIIGQLGIELGDTITVSGIVVEGPYKGYQGGLNIMIQMLRDSAIQNLIQIPISPYWSKFGENLLPKIKIGSTYRFQVYETGEYVGRPSSISSIWGPLAQTTNLFFSNKLIIGRGEKIMPIEWSPLNFHGQKALLSGIAKNINDTAVLQMHEWTLKLIGSPKWNELEVGKIAEVYGLIERTENKEIYVVQNGRTRLVKLEDQIGKKVSLRGIAINNNEQWWFNYRGTNVYIKDMGKMAGWHTGNHFSSIEITGILEEALLPETGKTNMANTPALKKQYIIRDASWISIETLLTPEIKW